MSVTFLSLYLAIERRDICQVRSMEATVTQRRRSPHRGRICGRIGQPLMHARKCHFGWRNTTHTATTTTTNPPVASLASASGP
jgi:hypothetical protein